MSLESSKKTLFVGVLVLLTAYKLYSYSKYGNRTITVLARDSIGYFLIILGI